MNSERRRLVTTVRATLRDLGAQLALLNRQVGARAELRDVDLGCLDLLSREGPLTPAGLARSTGLHPATVTGILDRLEAGGWVARERDLEDRRAVRIRVLSARAPELLRLYGGMNRSLDAICDGYSDAELRVLADFLGRAAAAGHEATEALAGEERS